MNITLDIPAQRIADLMTTAVEGDIYYWCGDVTRNRGISTARHWYEDPDFFEQDFQFTVREDYEDGEMIDHVVTKEKILAGLKIMAEKYPWHFASIIEENEDMTTADVFLQCIALGDIVYG